MSGRLLRRVPRTNIVSIRFTDGEIDQINRLIEKTGMGGSELIRYGAMHYIHRELNGKGSLDNV